MSAQEELEKLHSDIDATAFLANRVGDHRYSAQLREWADRIAAIREGLGKAQGEVQAYLTDEGSLLPVCFANEYLARGARLIPLYASAAPPADSAQALVEALESEHKYWKARAQRLGAAQLHCGAMATEFAEACDHEKGIADALAAHKSEVKG